MNVVCVVSGVRDSVAEFDVCGRGWTPSACAAGVCVRKAKGAPLSCVPFACFAGEVEDRGSCLGAVLCCNSDRSLAICASLRVFSATRAALSFRVSTSLCRKACRASGVSFGSLDVVSIFWSYIVNEHIHSRVQT